jgi:F-type H+-transporting ATPase subunit gamma
MAGGQERILRRRIRSIKSTQKITKAMELIAASQIVRAQGRIAASRPYQDGMSRIVLETAMGDWYAAGRLLGTPEEVSSVLVLCVVADRGLCGGYNSNVFRATERVLAEKREAGIETRLVTVGKKAQGYFRFRGIEVAESFLGMSERPTFADARAVASAAVAPFVAGEVDQVIVVSTRFLSAGSQRIEVRQLLPLADPRDDEAKADHEDEAGVSRNIAPDPAADVKHGYTEFEPDAAILLQDLAPKAAETAIFASLLEASASELTARQRAMAAATENAGELIKKYSRIMNRARQETITTEIMEIVGGAEALRAGAQDDEGGLVIQTTV